MGQQPGGTAHQHAKGMAVVRGAVVTYEGDPVHRPLSMRWLTLANREVVEEISTDNRGGYTVQAIRADEVYYVEIEGSVGFPSVVCPEVGLNYRYFLMAPSRETTAWVSGKVWANDGTTALPGTQQMRWKHGSVWATDEYPTTDDGLGGQDYEVPVVLYVGLTYDVYVNRGLAAEGPPGPQYCPLSVVNDDVHFKRESGTANALLEGSAPPTSNDYRMRWKDMTDAWVTYRFRILREEGRQLVSLPGGTDYHIMAKPAGAPDFVTTTPHPPGAPPGADPYSLPLVSGKGSDKVDCTLP